MNTKQSRRMRQLQGATLMLALATVNIDATAQDPCYEYCHGVCVSACQARAGAACTGWVAGGSFGDCSCGFVCSDGYVGS